MASKRIKYQQISLPKEVKDLYSENYMTLMNEIEDDTDGKIYYVHILKELILVKWPYYPRKSTHSAQSLSKYQGQRGGRELNQIGSYKPPSEFWIFPWMRWEGNRGFWAEEGHDLIYFLANHFGCCVETRVWRKKGRKSESSS